MIIGIDASRANLQHKTGTEWYSFYLIKNLAEIDKVNKYWLYINKPPRLELVEAVKNNPNFSFKLLNWPFRYFWTLGRLTLEMLWRRPDVLFVPAHALPLFGPLKTVNTIHDVAFWHEHNLYRSNKIKTPRSLLNSLINFFVKILTLGRYRSESVDYLYWSTAFALHHAKKIITVSQATKTEILNIYSSTKPAKIEVISNGYPADSYPPLDSVKKNPEILAKYDLTAPYFLYVGRLEKKKNTAALVEAFALLMENQPQISINLVLVGDAGFGYDEVKYIIQEFNLEKKVFLPGWVSEEDLPYIFSAASAFIFPSKYEGFGIPILQALACGVPTAVSNLSVLKEVAAGAVLYFDQNDKYSIYESMVRIIQDERLREELVAKGKERVKEFSWRKCAAETLNVLENL
ncbi:MAG: glycosyltransferase family 1 protein [Patescibacteria group bacterium]|jgi:glycosyltransferase involved in cell wall biosynthesis